MTLILSFFTNSIYERFGQRLEASARKLGLSVLVERVKDQGGWHANCHYKPVLIQEIFRCFPSYKAVIFIDADAVIHKRPELLLGETDFDLAARFEGITYGGTMYFKNNYKVQAVLSAWIEENAKAPGDTDQPGFMAAVRSVQNGIVFKRLPKEYDWIRRHDKEGDPVIEQFQVSRLKEEDQERLLV